MVGREEFQIIFKSNSYCILKCIVEQIDDSISHIYGVFRNGNRNIWNLGKYDLMDLRHVLL